MDAQSAFIAGMVTGGSLVLVSCLLTLVCHHILSLRSDRIRRQRDQDELLVVQDKTVLTRAQIRDLSKRVNKEMDRIQLSEGVPLDKLLVTETQVKEFLKTVNVDMNNMLSTVGIEGTIELLSIRIVRWMLDKARKGSADL